MMLFILITIFMTSALTSGVHDGAVFKVIKGERVNQAKGDPTCKEHLGFEWHLADGQRNQSGLYLVMRQNGLYEAWLALKRIVYTNWTWVNGNTYKDYSSLEQTYQGDLCGSVSLQHRDFPKAVSCTGDSIGYWCEFRDRKWCSVPKHRENCKEVQGRWFLLVCKSVNSWQQARSKCYNAGGDLAVLNTFEKFKALHEFTSDKKSKDGNDCRAYIGLRKEEWAIIYNDQVITILRKFEHRAVSAQELTNHSCMSVTRDIHEENWNVLSCNEQLPIVCQRDQDQREKHVNISDGPSSKGLGMKSALWIISTLSVLLVFLPMTPFICALKYRRKYKLMKRRPTAPEQVSVERQERNSLSDKPDNVASVEGEEWNPISEKPDLVTIVMFSAGIKETKGKISFENIPTFKADEGSVAADYIYEEYKQFLDEVGKYESDGEQETDQEIESCDNRDEAAPLNATKIYFKTDNKSSLRIFNLSCIGNCEQLSSKDTVKVLQYLLDNKDSIDIILLPGLAVPEDNENLDFLFQLRQTCVLVSFAKVKITELSASESIAFIQLGQKYERESQIYTGLVDVQIILEETIDQDKQKANRHECVARSAGLIAGLLKYCKENQTTMQSLGIASYSKLRTTKGMREFIIDLARKIPYTDWKEDEYAGFAAIKLDASAHKQAFSQIKRWSPHELPEIYPEKPDGDDITRQSVIKCLQSLEQFPEITIVLCSSFTNTEDKKVSIMNGYQLNGEVCHGDIVIKMLLKILHTAVLEKKEKIANIKLVKLAIRSTDVGPSADWNEYSKALKDVKKYQPDIIYVSPTKQIPPHGHHIKRMMLPISRNYVMLTGAKESEHANCCFPAGNMISPSYHDGPQGALVEFISNTPVDKEYTSIPERCDVSGANAVADTIGAMVALHAKIKKLGLWNEERQPKHRTALMRNILATLCKDFPNRTHQKGFGVLLPWTAFKTEDTIREILTKHSKEDLPQYWLGKNI